MTEMQRETLQTFADARRGLTVAEAALKWTSSPESARQRVQWAARRGYLERGEDVYRPVRVQCWRITRRGRKVLRDGIPIEREQAKTRRGRLSVLRPLCERPMTVAELADLAGVSHQCMRARVKSVPRRWLEVDRLCRSGRTWAKVWTITEAGRDGLRELESRMGGGDA